MLQTLPDLCQGCTEVEMHNMPVNMALMLPASGTKCNAMQWHVTFNFQTAAFCNVHHVLFTSLNGLMLMK